MQGIQNPFAGIIIVKRPMNDLIFFNGFNGSIDIANQFKGRRKRCENRQML